MDKKDKGYMTEEQVSAIAFMMITDIINKTDELMHFLRTHKYKLPRQSWKYENLWGVGAKIDQILSESFE
jgi:hypothetical protein